MGRRAFKSTHSAKSDLLPLSACISSANLEKEQEIYLVMYFVQQAALRRKKEKRKKLVCIRLLSVCVYLCDRLAALVSLNKLNKLIPFKD